MRLVGRRGVGAREGLSTVDTLSMFEMISTKLYF